MANDITKPNNHIYWLYILLFILATSCLAAYKDLSDCDKKLSEKASQSEMSLKVQLTAIQTKLDGIDVALTELKADLRHKADCKRMYYEDK